jgi:diadenosine tetraphosphate (Ap4A) HIT family hydrolase
MGQDNDLIYQTNFWKVILMPDQTYLGRCVVVLNRKCGSLAELSSEEISDFFDNVVKKLENAFRINFNATMFNWTCLMNDAYLGANPDPQVHWHFRPRYRESVNFLGEIFTDPNFGYHYEKGTEKIISQKIRAEIIKRIKSNTR